jgi:aminomethyltransferase
MDDEVDPLSAGLGFAVKWDHAFTGRPALEEIRDSGHSVPVAFRTPDRRIPRPGMRLRSNDVEGVVSSGSFSPVLECGIGLGRLDGELGDDLTVEIRGSWVEVETVRPPFHR